MQVPRHWRMKHQLYKLHGVRKDDGSLGMLNRPEHDVPNQESDDYVSETEAEEVATAEGVVACALIEGAVEYLSVLEGQGPNPEKRG